jgi:imidazolonepropionase-like amidohydrolase
MSNSGVSHVRDPAKPRLWEPRQNRHMRPLLSWRSRFLVPIAFAAIGVAAGAKAPHAAVAFRNVTVVPMDADRVIPAQTVVVRGSTIATLGPVSGTKVPAGASVIDGTGKFLMPGLADMHVHLPPPDAPAGRAEDELYVANGVTTVRSMAGFENHLALRARVNAGGLLGPTLILAGPGLDGARVMTPTEGERQVREQNAKQYDLLKVLPGLSLASYDAIVKTAREVRMPFAGHVPADVGLEHAIDSGQETIEHLDGYLELLNGRRPLSVDAMLPIVRKTKAAGVWNVPTMAVMAVNVGTADNDALLARSELEYIARSYVDDWLGLRARANIPRDVADVIQANRIQLLKLLHAEGARLLLGTDSPQLFNVPGYSIHRELRMMTEAGMTPFEVLQSGTEKVGEYLRRPCGTIAVKACADLILLDGNPLEDVSNVERITGVMVRGRWLPRLELQKGVQRIREQPGNYRLTN